jgi:hypothetical protein
MTDELQQFERGWESHKEYLRDKRELGYVADGWRVLGIFMMLIGFMLVTDMDLLAYFHPGNLAVNIPFLIKLNIIGIAMMIVGWFGPYKVYQRRYVKAVDRFKNKWGTGNDA